MKKLGKLVALVGVAAMSLAACAGGNSSESSNAYKIGIGELTQHPSLDASIAGFKRAFDEAGVDVEWDEQNANNEQGTAMAIMQQFSSQDLDLVLAVATPMAQAAAQSIVDTPVVFTAVTDAEEAALVDSNEKPGANVTGTSDMNPVEEQIKLVKQVIPDAKKVGVIYSSAEVNSAVQIRIAKKAADSEGLEFVEKTVTNSSEVLQAAQTLTDVDAIYLPTDNTVISALQSVIQVAEDHGILVVAGEVESVEHGAALTYGLDYEKLGYQTGQMALRILQEGADPSTTPVEFQKTPLLVVNPGSAEKMGHSLPQELLDKADITVE